MKEIFKAIMATKGNYERVLSGVEHAPRGNLPISSDSEELARAKAEYKSQLVKAINFLAIALSEIE